MKLISKGSQRYTILLVLAITVHVAFCLSLYYHFLNPLFYITSHSKGQGGPFFGIYQAGINLQNGESIYANPNYRAPTEVTVPYYHFYRYLPFLSYISVVMSKVLKPWPAYWTWIFINELLLAACLLLTLRLRNRFGPVVIAVSAFWLLYSPMYIELYMGQFCFTMSFFIFLILYPYLKQEPGNTYGMNPLPASGTTTPARAYGAPDNKDISQSAASEATLSPEDLHPASTQRHTEAFSSVPAKNFAWIPAVSWIFSVLLKSFTALYALTLIRIGKKRLVVTGIIAAILTSVPYFLRHPQDLRWFLHLNFHPLPPTLTGGCLGFVGLLRDVSNRFLTFLNVERIQIGFFDIAPRNIPLIAVTCSILLLSLAITIRKKRIDPVDNIALWTLTFFLVFKDIWEYHYVMLIPLFVVFYLQTRSKYILILFILMALPTPFIFYDVPMSIDPQVHWSTPLSLIHHSSKAIPTFLFYIWIVKREFRSVAETQAA